MQILFPRLGMETVPPYSGSTEPKSLDHHRSPHILAFIVQTDSERLASAKALFRYHWHRNEPKQSPWFHGAAILAGAARQKANGHRQGQVVIRVMERSPAEEGDIVTRLAILNWVVREGLIKW